MCRLRPTSSAWSRSLNIPPAAQGSARLSRCCPLLDEMNALASNRMDGVEQFVQAFWKFIGCTLEKEEFEEFLKMGAIMVPPSDGGGAVDVDLIAKELNQQQTQTVKDDCYNAMLTICGMPNRNGGSSTSDTGAAGASPGRLVPCRSQSQGQRAYFQAGGEADAPSRAADLPGACRAYAHAEGH